MTTITRAILKESLHCWYPGTLLDISVTDNGNDILVVQLYPYDKTQQPGSFMSIHLHKDQYEHMLIPLTGDLAHILYSPLTK